MAITSKNNSNKKIRFRSALLRYSVLYVLITFGVLLILNIYCSQACQSVFYNSKKTSMLELCQIASGNVADLQVLNHDTVAESVADITALEQTRLIVTDQNTHVIYDNLESDTTKGKYLLYPEIIKALEGNKVFHWNYHDGVIRSCTAMPIVSYGTYVGCVYMTEYDAEQGKLIFSLQSTIFTITLVLEIAVILFSLLSSNGHIKRLRQIMTSIRTVRNGDYSHKIEMSGHDELNILSAEFNDLITRLQVSESKRNRFVSDASHELKTPLASIKLLADSILQNDMDMDTAREFVGDIGNEAERLNRMSQKLLALSRIDARQETDAEITFIAPTVERVVRMLSPTAQNNQITVHTNLTEDCSVLILEDDLYQVLFNLVENGIKYNKKGGELFISLKKQEEDVLIEIRDTGMGIPDEALDHIFERFYRVDKARSRSTGGSGLGLSIVRNIIRRNHGKIHVDSTVGSGTTFTLQFPIFEVEEEQV